MIPFADFVNHESYVESFYGTNPESEAGKDGKLAQHYLLLTFDNLGTSFSDHSHQAMRATPSAHCAHACTRVGTKGVTRVHSLKFSTYLYIDV